MNFLFAPLPETNFQMSEDQLVLWQRNAIFECECDNLINSRVAPPPRFSPPGQVEQSAIQAAIQRHGLHHSRDNHHDHHATPPPQRPRLVANSGERERDNLMDSFYQEAIAVAIRERGLGLQRNPNP